MFLAHSLLRRNVTEDVGLLLIGSSHAHWTRSALLRYKSSEFFSILLVFLVAVTGLRISEALGLKWSDLDYKRQMINLQRVWVGNDMVDHMKTDGSAAPVPLGELLADALRSWYQQTPYGKPNDWVFPSFKLKGKTPLSASIMAADKIRPAALMVGIRLKPGQRFGFYNFRHSLATFLVSRGKDVKTIQELLRHAKVNTTLDLYSQAIDAAKLEAQEEIALAIKNTAVAAD
jgi:integrase